jgi:hypothetical protein
MAWGQPKRNGKNLCGHRGQCSCQRRQNEEAAANAAAMPRACSQMCGRNKSKACGATMRGGVCPCAYC